MPSHSFHVSSRAGDADKHQKDVNSLLFHKGKLYSAGDDGRIKCWSLDLTLLAQVQAHVCSVFSITASDTTLYSCSNDGSVKAWYLDSLKEKETVLKEKDTEFWVVRYADGVLYSADDQGNVNIIKNGQEYGVVNVADPVKDMAIRKNLMFTVRDTDVVVTDLHLGGDKPQFGVKATLMGRAPLTVLNDKLLFVDRDGKDLILNEATGHFNQIDHVKGAHEMIINAMAGVCWDGKPMLFSGGWDRIVKQWDVMDNGLKLHGTCNADIVVNSLASGEEGQIYAAGSDGHIVCMEV